MTGFRDAQTCPVWYAKLAWVGTAAHAHACREGGCLRECHGTPSGVLMDAVHLVAGGVAKRQRYDHAQAMKRLQRPPKSPPDSHR